MTVTHASQLSPRFMTAGFRRFTLAEYRRLTEIGILTEDDDIELLEGYLVQKMSRNPPHDDSISQTLETLMSLIPKSHRLRVQSAVALPNDSEPEPDFAIVTRKAYGAAHPTPADIACVIEVSDTSLDMDRIDKARIYADAAIPVYLIVDLRGRGVELRELPSASGYARTTRFGENDTLLLPVAGIAMSMLVRDLLPQ